jgi:hypothetical protein
VHPGALGDLLLTLPALARLGEAGYVRTIATAPRLGALLVAGGAAEAALDFDTLGLHHLFAAESEAAGPTGPTDGIAAGVATRLADFDLVVSWFGSSDAGYVRRIGTAARRVVVARPTPPSGVHGHAAAHLLATLTAVGFSPAPVTAPRLTVSPEAHAWVTGWLEARGIRAGHGVILQAGAGAWAKVWPAAPRLARGLRAAGWPIVVTAGPADGDALARLLDEGAASPAGVADAWPLDRLAALLVLARAYVGHDSGPTHLAAAVGCPTLALFGPTDPAVWAPVGERVQVLTGAGPGAPDPWAGLGVDQVLSALEGLAGEDASRRSGGEPASASGEASRSRVPA